MEKKRCIAMVPCPGQGHLIPFVEFGKTLVHHHNNLHLSFLIPTLGPPTPSIMAILNSLPPNIDFIILPHINIQDLPQNLHPGIHMKLTVTHSLPFLHHALTSLNTTTHLLALILDVFSADALPLAKQFNIPSYFFFTSGALTLSFCLSFPKLDDTVSSQFIDSTKIVNVPGSIIPFQVKDLVDLVLYERSSEIYKTYLGLCQQLYFVDGIIVNSFTDMEAEAIRVLQEKTTFLDGPSVYPVGPIIGTGSTSKEKQVECIEWLNKQPPKSVLYICFGSGGTITEDNLNEIAFGLELSGHKFVWVLRAPNNSASSSYLMGQMEDPLRYLPSGFLERTKEQGLVVPSWAPQIEILSHGSTGGFLSHCGWNSTLESVVHSVPMIAWPLFAEQRMNAIVLTDVLKVAVRAKVDDESSGIVKHEEIVRVIKIIMEGEEALQIRNRIKSLSDAALVALSEHGSSIRALHILAHKFQNI
ncbi:unnamed protein product [Lupinus luteus]|uniref:Glycosyltransferase n=1 Tax=Lupinus luteus TaxID=3873 RepID=A0AAV1W9Z9_LUPLU